MVILYLTCADESEAKTITLAILEARLAACIRRMPIASAYWWEGKIEHDREILLMIETKEVHFDAINSLVATLHSYKDYVLTEIPVAKTSPRVLAWIDEATK